LKLFTLALAAAFFFSQASYGGIITYTAQLSGPGESPPNASPGIGQSTIIIDTILNTMEVKVSFSDLLGPTTASHIHCCTALPGNGVADVATTVPSFTGFPLGVTSGTYDFTYDLLSAGTYNPALVTAHGGTVLSAEAALLAGALALRRLKR
jgi:hypothetical protein